MTYIKISQLLIGVYFTIGGIEWVYLSANKFLKTFFDTEANLLRLQDRNFRSFVPFFKTTEQILSKDRLTVTLASTLTILGIALIFSSIIETDFPLWWLPTLALLIHLLFCTLSGFGLEGSDQMASIVLFSLSVVYLVPEAEKTVQLFITVQLILSYGIAGISKLFSHYWRSGEAIVMILSTRSAGVGNAQWLKNNIFLSKATCIAVIVFEISWFALPINVYLAVALLYAGIIFHIVNSFLMGLNLFTWSFIAAYPWALYTILSLHR